MTNDKENRPIRFSIPICVVDEYEIREGLHLILSTCDPADIEDINIVYSRKSPPEYVAFLEELCREITSVKIQAVPQPVDGLGEAVYYCYSLCKGTHFSGLAGDMQLRPDDISLMMEKAKQNPDKIIKGSRWLSENGFGDSYPKIKLFFNRLFNLSAKLLLGSRQTDITYCYYCLPASCMHNYRFFKNHSGSMLEIAMLPELTGVDFVEFPSVLAPRRSGKSHCGFQYLFNLFICYIKIILRKWFTKR